jgi:hypothetical protein
MSRFNFFNSPSTAILENNHKPEFREHSRGDLQLDLCVLFNPAPSRTILFTLRPFDIDKRQPSFSSTWVSRL